MVAVRREEDGGTGELVPQAEQFYVEGRFAAVGALPGDLISSLGDALSSETCVSHNHLARCAPPARRRAAQA